MSKSKRKAAPRRPKQLLGQVLRPLLVIGVPTFIMIFGLQLFFYRSFPVYQSIQVLEGSSDSSVTRHVIDMLSSEEAMDRIRTNLNLALTNQSLANIISIHTHPVVSLIYVTVTYEEPHIVELISNELTEIYLDYVYRDVRSNPQIPLIEEEMDRQRQVLRDLRHLLDTQPSIHDLIVKEINYTSQKLGELSIRLAPYQQRTSSIPVIQYPRTGQIPFNYPMNLTVSILLAGLISLLSVRLRRYRGEKLSFIPHSL